jgi:hypothetical protein
MAFKPKLAPIMFIGAVALVPVAWSAQDAAHGAHHAASQTAQATAPARPAPMMPGMPGAPGKPVAPGSEGMKQQMLAMQSMHEKMMAAKTPAERQALMAEHMAVMQGGMGMMNQMGHGPMASAPVDMGTRQSMMEQRMDMMQSMMQMMMDRMQPMPAAK